MAVRAELEPRAKELRSLGKSYQGIADILTVNERTVRRWAKDWSPTSPMAKVINLDTYTVLNTDEADTAREWPGWTVEDLASMNLPGAFRPDLWTVNIELIHVAERRGNSFVPWFFRNLIEVARRMEMPDGSLPWSLAIASLPVLAEWLDCPPCIDLGELVEKHQPWDGGRQRGKYQRDARVVATAVGQCVFKSWGRSAMSDYVANRKEPSRLTKALGALEKRIPMFDRKPFITGLWTERLGRQIIDILTEPQED